MPLKLPETLQHLDPRQHPLRIPEYTLCLCVGWWRDKLENIYHDEASKGGHALLLTYTNKRKSPRWCAKSSFEHELCCVMCEKIPAPICPPVGVCHVETKWLWVNTLWFLNGLKITHIHMKSLVGMKHEVSFGSTLCIVSEVTSIFCMNSVRWLKVSHLNHQPERRIAALKQSTVHACECNIRKEIHWNSKGEASNHWRWNCCLMAS